MKVSIQQMKANSREVLEKMFPMIEEKIQNMGITAKVIFPIYETFKKQFIDNIDNMTDDEFDSSIKKFENVIRYIRENISQDKE